MAATIDILSAPKRILMLVTNPAVSEQTSWPIGFWWSELAHPYWEFHEAGYNVSIASPDGGDLVADEFSDPEDASGYSADDLISLGFKRSGAHAALLKDTTGLKDVDLDEYDALFLVGGQGPMYTFRNDQRVKDLVGSFFASGRVTAVLCHATCVLLDARTPDGALVVSERTWTGFANSEEEYADKVVGRRIQPFWIEDEARKLPGTSFIVQGRFRPHAVRDGNLITGQQQYSGAAAARLVVDALGR